MESRLTPELAEHFATIALGHVGREYPNKLDHVLSGPGDLATPRDLHPLFYGSFDWHSSVHSHWLLARVRRRYPDLGVGGEIRTWLDGAFTEANVAGELAFLARPSTAGFERPYGWAWLLMLQAELQAHETADGRRWAATLRPLAAAFERRFHDWLLMGNPYPNRVGTHGNTAFALTLLYAYLPHATGARLAGSAEAMARAWYLADRDAWPFEPSGVDFLSPTLEEAGCMQRYLPPEPFRHWFSTFLPDLATRQEPMRLLIPAQVSDRTDGQIAHLDGLNLSRAWRLRQLACGLRGEVVAVLEEAAERHLTVALPHLSEHYAGEHWLASFALLALDE